MVGLKAPEIDFLFQIMAGEEEVVTEEHWMAKIYDDVHNPL